MLFLGSEGIVDHGFLKLLSVSIIHGYERLREIAVQTYLSYAQEFSRENGCED
jgi:hypothetical protein